LAPTLAPSGRRTGATSVHTPHALAIINANIPVMINASIGKIFADNIGCVISMKNSVICIWFAIVWNVSAAIRRIIIGSISANPFTKLSQYSVNVISFSARYITSVTARHIICATTRLPVTQATTTSTSIGTRKLNMLPSCSPSPSSILYFLLASL